MISQALLNLISAVESDPHINSMQKQMLAEKLGEPTFFENLIHGAFGAGLALLVSKYLHLGKTPQILLTIAGYGIGKALWDAYDTENNFSRYNKQTKMYEIK
jgi:hypothetical protein